MALLKKLINSASSSKLNNKGEKDKEKEREDEKTYSEADYDVGKLKKLPLDCRKKLKYAHISPHDAELHYPIVLNLLWFDMKRHPEIGVVKQEIRDLEREARRNEREKTKEERVSKSSSSKQLTSPRSQSSTSLQALSPRSQSSSSLQALSPRSQSSTSLQAPTPTTVITLEEAKTTSPRPLGEIGGRSQSTGVLFRQGGSRPVSPLAGSHKLVDSRASASSASITTANDDERDSLSLSQSLKNLSTSEAAPSPSPHRSKEDEGSEEKKDNGGNEDTKLSVDQHNLKSEEPSLVSITKGTKIPKQHKSKSAHNLGKARRGSSSTLAAKPDQSLTNGSAHQFQSEKELPRVEERKEEQKEERKEVGKLQRRESRKEKEMQEQDIEKARAKEFLEDILKNKKDLNPKKLFTSLCRVGGGGFGDVYTAKDTQNNQAVVAIKEIRRSYEEDSLSIFNEIYMLKSCKHKNIVAYIETYLKDDKIWVVMEYCDGGTLHQLLKEIHLTEKHIAYLMKKILCALQYLHSIKRIHRDMKSENVLLNLNGKVKVADLGLCIEMQEGKEKRSMVGSRFWMAPEMIQRQVYNEKIDVWAAGCISVEMATGHPPYGGVSSLKAMLNVATRGVFPIKGEEKFSVSFKDFLTKCLDMNPATRWSCGQLLTHPFITSNNKGQKDKVLHLLEIVFLGNSLKMNGF